MKRARKNHESMEEPMMVMAVVTIRIQLIDYVDDGIRPCTLTLYAAAPQQQRGGGMSIMSM